MRKTGVLLVNLGTPDTPTRSGLRRYLNQFLTDRRVIDMPAFFRHLLFKGIVVPIRSGKVSKLYQELWLEEGSPLKVYGFRIEKQVQDLLGDAYVVKLAMRYRNPSIAAGIDALYEANVTGMIIFPLFPQYASATTGSVFEEVMRILKRKEQIPSIKLINSYYDHPDMIDIYADNARQYDMSNYNHIVFSFHGVPERYLKKENNYCVSNGCCCKAIVPDNRFCYAAQCNATAQAIAHKMHIDTGDYTVAYQSRFGPEKWIRPYTDEVLEQLLESGKNRVLVFSPAFVADCLETTMEIGVEYKEAFMDKGGEALDLVPSLNDDSRWAGVIKDIITENI